MQLLEKKKEKRKDGGKLFVQCYEKISRKNCNVKKKKVANRVYGTPLFM